MKVRVVYSTPEVKVDRQFTGATAEQVVAAMQAEVAGKLNFAMRLFVNAMTPLVFAQEVVRRYGQSVGKALPTPASCDEFLREGAAEGLLQVLEP